MDLSFCVRKAPSSNSCLSDNSEGKASDQNNCPNKKEAKFPVSTETIRKRFDPLSMKALDSYPALDLPCTQTVKDRVK